jgi:purine-nucleoside phosphorylase
MTTSPMQAQQALDDTLTFLRERGVEGPFTCAIVLGTGLGPIADDLSDAVEISYSDIPHFPRSGVTGHRGRLVAGTLGGKRVLALQGRAHYYESGDPGIMRLPIAMVAALGAEVLLVTNAAGSTRPEVGPPALVSITDHINLAGVNPLLRDETDGRFVPMTDAYDPAARARLRRAAEATGVALHEGVYAWFSGPSFETPAEVRMASRLGADLVGMSTVPEVILARYHGLPVAGVSVVTNLAAGIAGASPSHQETKDVAALAVDDLRRLFSAFVAE